MSVKASISIERLCICGHSDAAHARGGIGRCGFCYCRGFNLADLQRELVVHPEQRVAPGPEPERVSLVQAAEWLGFEVATLRNYVTQGLFPASKQGSRWMVLRSDIKRFRRRLKKVPVSPAALARLAQATSFRHMSNRLIERGRTTSGPLRGVRSRAQLAERTAYTDQLERSVSEAEVTADPSPTTLRQRALRAQREALDDMLRRPGEPHPPERSL